MTAFAGMTRTSRFPWPSPDIIISEKDGRLPLLRDFVSPFAYDGHPLVSLTKTEL